MAICRIVVAEGWLGITAAEVAPRHRRHGLATHLLGAALEHPRERGVTHVYLQTTDENEAALTLYGSAGFPRGTTTTGTTGRRQADCLGCQVSAA